MKKFFKRTFKQHRHPSKNSNDHPCEEKQACHPDSPKASSSDAHSTTVNNFYNINNSSGFAIGEHSRVTDNSFTRHEQSAARDDVSSRVLEDELRLHAEDHSEEIQPPPIELERPIVPVSLQIAKEPVRVPNAFDADGHLHRRKDIVKFYEHPPGDISEENMFDLPKQQAQQEAAKKKFKTGDAKVKYIKKHGNILAVIGWPGIGKTTSMKKWMRQIVKGKLIPGVKYVFFIFVRHIDFSKKMTVFQFLLSTIIPDWDHSTESDKAWLKKLFSDPNVLIALEGFDESAAKDLTMRAPRLNLYDTADPLDIMLNLIGGKLLPLAHIVISSRPDQLFHLHPEHRPKCIVQILGLNKDAQNELGHQIWGDRYELARVILDDNPDTFAYCFVPVNFLLTVDYLMSESEVDSVCMTRVLASACKRYAVSDHLHGEECDLDKLSKLAWNGYKKMQIVFEEADFKKANIDKNTIRSYLHISVVKDANIKMTIMDGEKRSSFSHLIWQEFLVAAHIMLFECGDFDQHLLDICEDRWEMVSKFMFGLCNSEVFTTMKCFKGSCPKDQWQQKRSKLQTVAMKQLLDLPSSNNKWKSLLQVCSWIHEANDENISRDVAAHLPHLVKFPHATTILPSDVSDLFYALQSCPLSHTLDVENCNFTGDSLKIFSKEVSFSNIKIQRFNLYGKKLNDEYFSSVVEILQHVEEELGLRRCGITSCQVSSLAEKLSETGHKIQDLDLSGNKFCDEGLFNLVLCLKNIQKLILWNCDISSAGCAKLAEKLIETGHRLELLNLSGNKLIGDGARSLIPCLHLIEELELIGCNVTEAVKEEIRSELKRLGLPESRVRFRN